MLPFLFTAWIATAGFQAENFSLTDSCEALSDSESQQTAQTY
jgi:hypothetical protein